MTWTRPEPVRMCCPQCGQEIPVDQTWWPMLGQWYCSERCVRAALPMAM